MVDVDVPGGPIITPIPRNEMYREGVEASSPPSVPESSIEQAYDDTGAVSKSMQPSPPVLQTIDPSMPQVQAHAPPRTIDIHRLGGKQWHSDRGLGSPRTINMKNAHPISYPNSQSHLQIPPGVVATASFEGVAEAAPPPPRGRHRRSRSDGGKQVMGDPAGYANFPRHIAVGTPIMGPAPLPVYASRDMHWAGPPPPPPPLPPHRGSMPPMSPNSNPLIPYLTESVSSDSPSKGEKSTQYFPPPQFSTPQSGGRRKRKGGGHRRAHSTSEAVPGAYTSFFNPDLPPPSQGPSRRRTDFSPRSELMSLTGSFHGASRNAHSPTNPLSKTMPMPDPYHSHSHRAASPFLQGNNMAAWSPSGPPMYGSTDLGPNNVYVATPPKIPDPSKSGGEAAVLARRMNKRREGHSRHKHMRQHSAQLFMEEFKGVEQPPACRDVLFLLLFLFHIVGMIYLGNTYGQDAFDPVFGEPEYNGIKLHYGNFLILACFSGVFAVALSILAFIIVTIIARRFVQVALCLAITVSFAWGTIGIGLSPKNVVPITGFIAFALSVAYTFIVWDRIPFVAANLLTALSGMRTYWKTLLVSFFFQLLSLAWSIYFTIVVVGVFDAIQIGTLELSPRMQIFVYTMLGVSYYWTIHVFLNLVQVTTAGVVGRWWYKPSGEIDKDAVGSSLFKTVFYGLGSVCFGSLLVGPVKLIRQLSVLFRPSSDDSALMCLHECLNCIQSCITSCVDSLADHFNPWAYTYIGLYGYSFLDAGSQATDLFRKRGWTMIVTDDLVPNILLMTSLVIGGATGCFAHLYENLDNFGIDVRLSSRGDPGLVSFGMGLVIGLVVTSVLFSVISSSVNAVLVCFAASPVDFEKNHPQLSRQMRAAWREVWPGCTDAVDLSVSLNVPVIPNEDDPHVVHQGHPLLY